MYSEAFSVGPLVADMIGLNLSGVLCTFGRKYIVWVFILLGGVSL